MKTIYLDYAAATPVDQRVLEPMQPYFSQQFYNPSATYLTARKARRALETARSQIAEILGAKSTEIIFTAGATEANNLAIQGVMRHFKDAKLLVSVIEHDSVLAPANLFKSKSLEVQPNGLVDLKELEAKIKDDVVLISIMLVNNEIGSVQPLREIAQILGKVRAKRLKSGNKLPLYLHTDAAQAANFVDLHVSRLGVDLMSLNGGKIYGPKQTGVLFIKTGTLIEPLILGGGQEFGYRSGTENLAGAIGLSRALRIAQDQRASESQRLSQLRDYFIGQLLKLPDVQINGLSKHMAPHIVSAAFAGVDNERLMMELDEAGIICGLGSACSAANQEPSHVLSAIGLSRKQAESTLRFSMGRATTLSQIKKTIAILDRLLSVN